MGDFADIAEHHLEANGLIDYSTNSRSEKVAIAKGTIEVVYKNEHGFVSVKLNDNNWYSLGKSYGPFSKDDKGRTVEFQYEEKTGKTGFKNLNVDLGTVKFDTAGRDARDNALRAHQDRPTAEIVRIATPSTGTGKDAYWANKEARDIDREKVIGFNGAYNAAVALVTAAVANGSLKLAAEDNKRYSEFKLHVNGLAEELYVKFQSIPTRHNGLMGLTALEAPVKSTGGVQY